MKNLVLLLTIFVIFITAIVFVLVLQNEENIKTDPTIKTVETKTLQKSTLKPEPEISKRDSIASNTPLEVSDHDLQQSKNDETANNYTKTHKPEPDSNQLETVEIEMSSLIKEKNTNISNADSPLKKPKINSSTVKINGQFNTELSEPIIFTFDFSTENISDSSSYVSISVPIKTHTGKINNYSYSAILDNEQFTLTWETPGWYQINFFATPIKYVKQTYNSVAFSNLTALQNFPTIHLHQKIPIEFTFETSDGTSIPDGSKIKFLEQPRWINNITPNIVNQKGIIYIQPEKVSEIATMSVGSYFAEKFFVDSKSGANLSRTILLKKKVSFKAIIVDQKQKPQSDYYIVFSKTFYPNGIYQVLADYQKKEDFDETKYDFLHKSDANGEIIGEVESLGEYCVNIFGPKLKKGALNKIIVASEGEVINISIDIATVELKINFLENGKPYLEELNGTYLAKEKWNYFTTKSGDLTLNQIPSGKFEIHIKSNVFLNETTKLILPEEGVIEKNIELKPGAFLSGKLTSNGAPILGKKLRLYLYEKGFSYYDHFTETDLNGCFKFTGLNPEIIYIFHVDLQNYILDPAFSKEYRANENEVLVSLIEKFDFSGLVFDEKGVPVKIEKASASILRGGKTFGWYPKFDKNKFTLALDAGDTISFYIQAKNFASYKQTVVFDPSLQTEPIIINLKKGILVKGIAIDTSNKPLTAGLIIEAIPFEYNNYLSNRVYAGERESAALSGSGTFQIENAQIGERYFVLSIGNSPIPFTIEEKHHNELIELKATKSYSFSGNLRSQKNVLQEGRKVTGVNESTKETVMAEVDAKGNFYINCLRPGKWVFTSNFRDLYKVVPRIEIEIVDKDETYDWVVFR